MGYLDEALGMRRRYRTRRAAWQPHLDRSKRFVLAAAARCPRKNKVVILGSGLLLDVPLPELSSLFSEIILADLVCLPEARRLIRMYPGAGFIEHDVTAVAQRLSGNGQCGLPDPPESISLHAIYQGADLVVSLNILSQLWVIPRAYVVNRRTPVSPEQLDAWCSRLVTSHAALLQNLPCAVCLIADHRFVKRDRNNDVISAGSTVYDLVLPAPDAAWTWNIAPLNTESTFFAKELEVGAWHVK